jgi:hypothetical protein
VKNPNFCQTIEFRTDRMEELLELAEQWDEMHAMSDVMGFIGTQVLADRSDPGRFIVVAEFAAVQPGVSAYEEAVKNNDREVTQQWAARLRELSTVEPIYHDYDEIYRTG